MVEKLIGDHPVSPVRASVPRRRDQDRSQATSPPTSNSPLVIRRSGSTIRGEHPSRWGIKMLTRALFLSAFAAVRDLVSLDLSGRKISRENRHNQPLIALARRRFDVLSATLFGGTP